MMDPENMRHMNQMRESMMHLQREGILPPIPGMEMFNSMPNLGGGGGNQPQQQPQGGNLGESDMFQF